MKGVVYELHNQMADRSGRLRLFLPLSQIGDWLRSTTKNIQGTVRNAKYADREQDGPFWITYHKNNYMIESV
jgi:hypothetical protein